MPRARVKSPLADPLRVATLRGTGLLGNQKTDAFDRLANLARTFVGAPIAMVDAARRYAPARAQPHRAARPRQGAAARRSRSAFCQHVVASASR